MRSPILQGALAGLAMMMTLTASPAAAVTYASTLTLHFGELKTGVESLTPNAVIFGPANRIATSPINLSVDLQPGASVTQTLGTLQWARIVANGGSTVGYFGIGLTASGGAFPGFSAYHQGVLFDNSPLFPRLSNLPGSAFDISPVLPPGLTMTNLRWRLAPDSPETSQYSIETGWRPTSDKATSRIFETLELVGDFHAARDTAGAIPEPATWALLIGGFALTGVALRRRQPVSVREQIAAATASAIAISRANQVSSV